MKAKKIAFFGTPLLARACLIKLTESFDVELVITRPDTAKGRGRKIGISPVKDYAEAQGIEIYQPDRIGKELLLLLKKKKIDLNVVVAFGKILPSNVIDLPPFGSVNLHASMLPKYRGPSPIVASILNGDRKTGVTLQKMEQRMDRGDIILQKGIDIESTDTSHDLLQKIIDISPVFLVEGIRGFIEGEFQLVKQREGDATYCSIIKKSDGLIDWHEESEMIINKIRAYNLWPVAYTYLDGKLLKIFQVRFIDAPDLLSAQPGKIVKTKAEEGIIVQTGKGFVNILELQMENHKKINSRDFINGYRNLESKTLEISPH
ncbi:MAG: methionyl-tRNA formyltransferase [Spirochaetota bacterium]|nr:MAG: methionyl-tRNA formyltransferase [Spirochaetota bacterium]